MLAHFQAGDEGVPRRFLGCAEFEFLLELCLVLGHAVLHFYAALLHVLGAAFSVHWRTDLCGCLGLYLRLRSRCSISGGLLCQNRQSQSGSNSGNEPTEDLSLEDYFQHFVLEHQDHMTETELARKLGISRKCLWERRQRLGIPRRKSGAVSS